MRRFLLSSAVIVASAGFLVSYDPSAVRAPSEQAAVTSPPRQVATGGVVGDPAPAVVGDGDGRRPGLLGSLILPVWDDDDDDDDRAPRVQIAAAAPAPAQTPTPTPTPTPTVPTPPTADATTGQYSDGTYTGASVYAVYGQVQVQVVVSGGRVTSVNVLDYPAHTRRSQRISDIVLPQLRSEVIQNQTTSVSFISGATLTVRAFRTSLSSALNAALI